MQIIANTIENEKEYHLDSVLLKSRTIILSGEITRTLATSVTKQLIYLEAIDPLVDIRLYINSPGGSISDGLAIYDIMQLISCDISTIGMGYCCSMGALLLMAGAKGKRFALPNTEIMMHQLSGGVYGQGTEIDIENTQLLKLRK